MKNPCLILSMMITCFITACNPKNCEDVPPYFDIKNLNLEIKKIAEIYADQSFSTTSFDLNNLIAYNEIVLEITPQFSYYGNVKPFNFKDLFINTAYAGKCPEPGHKGSTAHISKIAIFSNQPFTDSNSIQDDLSTYFKISGLNQHFGAIKQLEIPSFLSTKPDLMRVIQLTMKENPTVNKEHEFTIIYEQSNGKTFELITPLIKFE